MKIKICGLSREEDICYANEAKPDYIGFVFAKSKRQVTHEKAAFLRKNLSADIVSVGVFADNYIQNIVSLFRKGVIHLAQLHGNEDEKYIAALKEQCGMPIIKVIKIGTGSGELPPIGGTGADYIMFDSGAGSGLSFDWSVLQTLIPHSSFTLPPIFLAGGINMENIHEAIRHKPFCIDVSSGAETNDLKDKEKMLQLVNAVHFAE